MYRQRLAVHLDQRAIQGRAFERPEVTLSIRECRQEIAGLKETLRNGRVPVEDQPNDVQPQDEPIPPLHRKGINLVLGDYVFDQLSLEAYAITFLCAALGVVLGINMMPPWGGFSGGLLGTSLGWLVGVAYRGKNEEDRRRYAFYITRLEFPYLFEERIQALLAQRWYVTPADLDDLKYTWNLDDEHLTYPLSHYAEKHPGQVQYVYLYDKHTRQPIAYKRGTRGQILTPVKVLVDATQTVPDAYIIASYPLLPE